MSKFNAFLDKKFDLTKKGTSVKTEVMAGLTTFMAMVYILMVNAGMFADLGVVSYGAMYIVTALSAIVGTVLIGLLSGLPLAQAPGMGLNAFFVYTICFGFGFSYANTLVFILIDGLVFIALTATGLRKKIFEAIPADIKKAIPAGIGLFIAFLGLQNAGLVVADASTGVTLGSMNLLGTNAWAGVMPLVVCVLGVIAIAAMSKKNVKGAILWGILGAGVLYFLLGLTVPGFYSTDTVIYNVLTEEASGRLNYFGGYTASDPDVLGNVTYTANKLSLSIIQPFKDFGTQAVGKVFTEGFNFGPWIKENGAGQFILMLVTTSLAFCLVDMFDTLGTLYGACKSGNLLDENGDVPNMNKAMMADAIATCTGAILGTSTVTTFVESSAGTAAGGKTALTSYVIAALFAVAMFLSPIAQLIPSCATATALIYVGILMMNNVRDIEWTDPAVALPAFLTIAMMPFTYNISFGIGFGLISHVLIKVCTGKAKEISIATYVLTAIFLLMFLFTH
ncbi:MAG: NCS2 family permease [Clostridia bacterium]|nr:NCS2 family permease [Clostridia bacterium]